jgi:hypothetical protein
MRKQSNVRCPDSVCEALLLPCGTLLTDVVDYLRETHGVHVEVFLSGNSTTHTKKHREYTIRVTDDSGGNVSKYSTKDYIDCLVDGVATAVAVCFS